MASMACKSEAHEEGTVCLNFYRLFYRLAALCRATSTLLFWRFIFVQAPFKTSAGPGAHRQRQDDLHDQKDIFHVQGFSQPRSIFVVSNSGELKALQRDYF